VPLHGRHNRYRPVKPSKIGDGSCNVTLRTYSTTLCTTGRLAQQLTQKSTKHIHLLRHYFCQTNRTTFHSDRFAWRRATQRSSLFQFAGSWALRAYFCILQLMLGFYWLYLRQVLGMVSFESRTSVTSNNTFILCRCSAGEVENTVFWMLSFRLYSLRGLLLYTLSLNTYAPQIRIDCTCSDLANGGHSSLLFILSPKPLHTMHRIVCVWVVALSCWKKGILSHIIRTGVQRMSECV
jgi:hypothetical protein